MTYSARALCESLARAGVTITARSRTQLYLTPRAAVDDALIAMLTRYKVELLGALWRAVEARNVGCIAACVCCDSEFTIAPERLCPWCTMTAFNTVTPGSCHETVYLNAQSAHRECVSNCLRKAVGDSGDTSLLNLQNAHVRARLRENPESASQLSHPLQTLSTNEAA